MTRSKIVQVPETVDDLIRQAERRFKSVPKCWFSYTYRAPDLFGGRYAVALWEPRMPVKAKEVTSHFFALGYDGHTPAFLAWLLSQKRPTRSVSIPRLFERQIMECFNSQKGSAPLYDPRPKRDDYDQTPSHLQIVSVEESFDEDTTFVAFRHLGAKKRKRV